MVTGVPETLDFSPLYTITSTAVNVGIEKSHDQVGDT